ncbi:MAG: hypothetical protein J6P84_05865 [Alphaproteobacteria bacterium]|nr:hypothetical protein [Alphaproteobacteria bacterium]
MRTENLKNEQKSPLYIAEFEQPFEACKVGPNYAVYEAYQKSRKIEKDLIDFHDMIWPNEIEAIINTLKACDVKEFTISCRSTNLIDCLVIFEKFNCKMNGLAEVKTGWKRIDGSVETISALKMRIGI